MPPKPFTGASLVLITIGLSLGTFMQVLDTSIANVSIPAIAGDLKRFEVDVALLVPY